MKRVLAILPVLVAPACGGGDHGPGHSDVAEGRVVTMTASDALRFDPSTVQAKAGEKVTFRIANAGKTRHEFVIGNADYQATHRTEMASGSPHHGGHGEGGASVELPPGSTGNLTFTMPATAPTFACYVDRHNEAGMTGTVVYG